MAGCGFPVASHWKVTVLPTPTTWFLGLTTNVGGTAGQSSKKWLPSEQTNVIHYTTIEIIASQLPNIQHYLKERQKFGDFFLIGLSFITLHGEYIEG